MKLKKILIGVLVVALLAVFAVWMLASPKLDHIEDTNGADDYSLETITDKDIAEQALGTKGSVSKREIRLGNISNGIEYSSKKFTGVHRVYTATIIEGSDIHVNLVDFQVKEGNFAFAIVYDGEVVGKLVPDEFASAEFIMENVENTAELEFFIAGESANFKFTTPTEFD